MKNKLKIIIVDASSIICQGLTLILESNPQIAVVAQLNDMERIKERIVATDPDILIINPSILGHTQKNLPKLLEQEFPQLISIALVSTYVEQQILKQYRVCIEIDDSHQKIISKISNIWHSENESNGPNSNIDLTSRETDVLIAVAKGLMNKEISDLLNISIHTVISHRKNISKKTGIKSVSGLTVYALLNNLIEESDINK